MFGFLALLTITVGVRWVKVHWKFMRHLTKEKRGGEACLLVQNKASQGGFLAARPFPGPSQWRTQMAPPQTSWSGGSQSIRSLLRASGTRWSGTIIPSAAQGFQAQTCQKKSNRSAPRLEPGQVGLSHVPPVTQPRAMAPGWLGTIIVSQYRVGK